MILWLHPEWLWLLAPVLALAGGAYYVGWRRRGRRLALFMTAAQARGAMRGAFEWQQRARWALLTAGLCCLVVALARPVGLSKEDKGMTHGIEAYVALDLSKSMGTPDVQPYRLGLAREGIKQLRAVSSGGRLGLITFAGEGYIVLPLTLDESMFNQIVDKVSPYGMGIGGSNIEAAIVAASQSVQKLKLQNPLLVIVSDGEELDGNAVAAAAIAWQQHHLRIYTVGVGTAEGGQVGRLGITGDLLTGSARNEFKAVIHSRLDAGKLRAIAEAGGGRYVELVSGGTVMEDLFRRELSRYPARPREVDLENQTEWFWVLVAAGMALMVGELILRKRRAEVSRWQDVPTVVSELPEAVDGRETLDGVPTTHRDSKVKRRLQTLSGGGK